MAAAESKTSADAITPAPEIQRDHDRAADFLASHGDTSFTAEEEKAVLRKIDTRVLVLLLWAYFFQQLDKSTLRFVSTPFSRTIVTDAEGESTTVSLINHPVTSIFGIVDDAHLVGKQYSWLGSILYIAQLVMQPIAAVLLVKFPNGKVIASAVFLWGSALCIMSACTNFASLLGLRFVLGTFEAMIAPCCVAITQMWWRRGEQTLRTSYWNAMNGLTSIIGSLFTYGLGHIESKVMFKYQVIFLFCGLLTVFYSVLVFALMPDSPMEAKFISEREKVIATERLRANQMGVASRTWRWDHVWETAYDLKTWCWFIAILAISISSGGITAFGSLIVKSFGYSSFQTILFNIPFGAIQIIAIIGTGWIAQRIQRKGLVIAATSVLPTIGTVLLLTVPRHQKGVLLFGYYLVSCLAAITPMLYNWQAVNSGGDTKKKCTSAVVFIGMCAGNVIGPLLYSTEQAPLYRAGLISNLIMFVLVGVIAALIPFYLMFLNKRHSKRREQLGKSATIIDESMISKHKMQASKAVEVEDVQIPQRRTLAEDRGLLDLTDLNNEDFVYVY